MRNQLISRLFALLPMLAFCRPLSLVVSIAPQKEALAAIAGDNATVRVLVPKGASPETYSPTAAEIRRLSDADMLFTIGVPMEKALIPKIRQTASGIQIVDTTARMKFREMEGGHSGHAHGANDPHVWLSVDNMIVHAQNVSLALAEKDADNAEAYISRANAYITTLKKLKGELAADMSPLSGEKLLVFHPAFGYFLAQHGIAQVPVEMDGHEPTGKHLAELTKTVGTLKVKALFVQPQSNKVLSESIAKMLSVPLMPLDPLPDEYSAGMKAIAKTILNAQTK